MLDKLEISFGSRGPRNFTSQKGTKAKRQQAETSPELSVIQNFLLEFQIIYNTLRHLVHVQYMMMKTEEIQISAFLSDPIKG